jgi:hypothetical protein
MKKEEVILKALEEALGRKDITLKQFELSYNQLEEVIKNYEKK